MKREEKKFKEEESPNPFFDEDLQIEIKRSAELTGPFRASEKNKKEK